MKTSEQLNEVATALAKAQAQMGGAEKGSVNPHFRSKFADLGSVIAAIKAPFAANNLCFVQGAEYADGQVVVTTRILHCTGQWIESSLAAPVTKKDSQGVGSTLSYCKRYSLQSLCGLPSVDDDAESAMMRQPEKSVTDKQAAEIKQACEELAVDVPKFLGAMKHAGAIDDLPASHYQRAVALLERKRKSMT